MSLLVFLLACRTGVLIDRRYMRFRAPERCLQYTGAKRVHLGERGAWKN